MDRKIKIRLKKSLIGRKKDQKDTVYSLGLRKIGSVVEHKESPHILGMVNKVKFLLDIIEN